MERGVVKTWTAAVSGSQRRGVIAEGEVLRGGSLYVLMYVCYGLEPWTEWDYFRCCFRLYLCMQWRA